MSQLNRVAVIGSMRIPFCRSSSAYSGVPNKSMMTKALKGLVNKFQLQDKAIGEVCLGAVLKHARDFSLARESTIEAGLAFATPGLDIQRACGTSLEAAVIIAHKIALGEIDSGIAAGVDTSSEVPIELKDGLSSALVALSRARSMKQRLKSLGQIKPQDLGISVPAVKEPRTGLSMGEHCEIMAKEWSISRDEQDELAMASHRHAEKAYAEGFYDDLLIPYKGVVKDNNIRPTIDQAKMGKLKPAFDTTSGQGTLTAANSSPLTDGAAAVLLGSEAWAKKMGLPVLAYLTYSGAAAVDFESDEGLLMAPAYAVPRMLARAGMGLGDFDLYEIHEAFAAQVLCTLKAWESKSFAEKRLGLGRALGEIDRQKMNTKGGSIAIGHPFAATGARILGTLAKSLHGQGGGRGLISICTAGGMGVCAILEGA